MEKEKIQCFYNFLREEEEKANRVFFNGWYRRGYVDFLRKVIIAFEIEFREELE